MDKDGVSAEEIRAFMRGVLSALSSVLVHCRPIDQLITIDDRLRQRWPTASKQHQRRVRDVCVNMYRERLGRHPLKLTGAKNGTFAVEREHLDILDGAIDKIKSEVEGEEDTPLFPPRPG